MRVQSILLFAAVVVTGCESPTGPRETPARFATVAAGPEHTCATSRAGLAYCWGQGTLGRLGTAAVASDSCQGEACPLPLRVPRSLEFATLAAGAMHNCGVSDDTVYCWGWNRHKQLGEDSTLTTNCPIPGTPNDLPCSLAPIPVVIGYELVDVAAYDMHSCAVAVDGAAYCWGWNRGGQLGIGTAGDQTYHPVRVLDAPAFTAITTGEGHTCALTEAGAAYCWGTGQAGRLGTGDSENRYTPHPVPGPHVFVMLDAGAAHTCGVRDDGSVQCWGWGANGRLGSGNEVSRAVPTPVQLAEPVTRVSAGSAHSCAVGVSGQLYCWGANDDGQLGDGSTAVRLTPVEVDVPEAVRDVSAGGRHTCAVTTAGSLYCWGANEYGQLGNGSLDRALTPVRVGG